MLSLFFRNPIEFFILAGLLLIALSIHEFSHALVADHLGDPTAKLAGRLTLNPLAHLDPIGTFLILFAGFGWGKPVPIDIFNLRNPKRDSALISFAGPFSNLLMAIFASLLLRLMQGFPLLSLGVLFTDAIQLFVYFNVLLCVFNLLPIHPLDGFSVVAGLMPKQYYHDWLSLQQYGIIFLLLLVFPFFGNAAVTSIISPIVNFILSVLLPPGGGII